MNNKVDFRLAGTQVVNLPWSGETRITYVGICPITGIRLYESDKGNDPRGILGKHAIYEFVASNYGMIGPTVHISWFAYNDARQHDRALRYAKSRWTKPEKEATCDK